MKKQFTMKDGKTRSAATGPWIDASDATKFIAFCKTHGHDIRNEGSHVGFQVRHQGHWMRVSWNSAWGRYTADRRLTLIVQSFAENQKTLVNGQ